MLRLDRRRTIRVKLGAGSSEPMVTAADSDSGDQGPMPARGTTVTRMRVGPSHGSGPTGRWAMLSRARPGLLALLLALVGRP